MRTKLSGLEREGGKEGGKARSWKEWGARQSEREREGEGEKCSGGAPSGGEGRRGKVEKSEELTKHRG